MKYWIAVASKEHVLRGVAGCFMQVCLYLCIIGIMGTLFYSAQTEIDMQHIRLGIVGDVMLGRTVNELLRANPNHNLWGTMLPVLQSQNVVIANLETAITNHTSAVPKVFNFKTDPNNTRVLEQANIDIVNLANNHVRDFGIEGMAETIESLDTYGIAHVGAGDNMQDAQKPYIFTIQGTSFALIGATDNEPGWKAGDATPGVNYIAVGDTLFLEHIKQVKSTVDILIVTLHWGPNMREYPSQDFIDYAHAMIDAGADMVAGHSAHVVQGIEVYKGKLVLYDMGDFIDDYAVNTLRNDLTALFSVTVENKRITALDIIPAHIQQMVVDRAYGKVAHYIFDLIKKRSNMFGTAFVQARDSLRILIKN